MLDRVGRRWWWVWLMLCVALGPVGQAAAGADQPPLGAPEASEAVAAEPLLPDLRTLPPSDLYIQPARGGARLLRLANTVWNSGAGPLNLVGALSPSIQQTIVIQQLSFPDSDEI